MVNRRGLWMFRETKTCFILESLEGDGDGVMTGETQELCVFKCDIAFLHFIWFLTHWKFWRLWENFTSVFYEVYLLK